MTATADPHRIASEERLRELIGSHTELVTQKLWRELDENCMGFIKRSPFLLLSTADAEGNQEVSPKGDSPGFVAIENETTLLIPDRPGNKLIFGLTNTLVNPNVGLIFLVPGTPETLRLSGTADLTTDPEVLERLSARGKTPIVAIRVKIKRVYYHCGKALIRSKLWQPDTWPERIKISFGKMLAAKTGGDSKMAEQIDERVEQEYRTNL